MIPTERTQNIREQYHAAQARDRRGITNSSQTNEDTYKLFLKHMRHCMLMTIFREK